MSDWQLSLTPQLTGAANMELDLKLFEEIERGSTGSTLRIFSWHPNCVSLGYAQKAEKVIDAVKAKNLGWDVVKRPTGGGIVFHNEAEVAYSIVTEIDNPLFPKGLVPAYKKISEAIVGALGKIGVSAEILNTKYETLNKSKTLNSKVQNNLCFSYPAEYEIVVAGKKIVGSAQKRGKRAMLQQGSIFVRQISPEIFSVLKELCGKHNAISVEEVLRRAVGFDELSQALINGFTGKLGVSFED